MPRSSKEDRAEYMREYRAKKIGNKFAIKSIHGIVSDILAGKKAAAIKKTHSLDTNELREIMKIIKEIKDA